MWLKRLYRWWIEKGPPSMRYINTSCPDDGNNRQPIRRCSVDGLTYNAHPDFKKCDVCGEETEVMCVLPDTLENGEPPTYGESMALRHEVEQQRVRDSRAQGAAREAQRAAEAEATARVTDAAVAALNYDLDRWLDTDPSEWGWSERGK